MSEENGNGIVDSVQLTEVIKKKLGRPKLLPGQKTIPQLGKKLGRPRKHPLPVFEAPKKPVGRPKSPPVDAYKTSPHHDRYFRNTKDVTDVLVNLLLKELNEIVRNSTYSYEEMLSGFSMAVSVIVAQMTCPDGDFEMESDKFAHIMKHNARILRGKMKEKEKIGENSVK